MFTLHRFIYKVILYMLIFCIFMKGFPFDCIVFYKAYWKYNFYAKHFAEDNEVFQSYWLLWTAFETPIEECIPDLQTDIPLHSMYLNRNFENSKFFQPFIRLFFCWRYFCEILCWNTYGCTLSNVKLFLLVYRICLLLYLEGKQFSARLNC